MTNIKHEERVKILEEIQASVPQKWKAQLFKTIKISPAAEFLAKKALKEKDFDPIKKERLRILLDTGEFSKTKTVLNQKMADRIDKFVERQIKHAIKTGRLPKPEDLQEDEFIKSLKLNYVGETN